MSEAEIFTLSIYILFAFIALVCEYVDSALGGGYGTLLVPLLMIIFNVPKALIVPAVLFTEFISGFSSAYLHHRMGNANFELKRKNNKASVKKVAYKFSKPENSDNQIIKTQRFQNNHSQKFKDFVHSFHLSEDFQISFILGFLGIVGGIVAAFVGINIPDTAVKTYIGVLVIVVGLIVLVRLKWKFSWWKISAIGLVAAFNKGLSGGGYGPLVSSGQIIVDRDPRQAVASTSLSEAIVCVASLAIYLSVDNVAISIGYWYLLIPLLIGSLLSVPFAVLTVKYLPIKKLQPAIGVITILLGIFMLLKAYLPAFA
ncbi:MAG: sulfite exporter TauE/SafE family protein [Candidatus Heimdallarchaeota archaeon]|nr:sulfite exporter TauE/SafE family protein [Candidatus Heimdallarchaeota archaeon]